MSSDCKYIGLDVHKEAISIAVLNRAGKLVMESIIETKAISLVQFLQGLRGELQVTLEEGTWAAWLYDVLKPHVSKIVVCNPRRNAYLKEGSKSDRVDARKLAELLRAGMLRSVYHGENGLRTLRELARSYQVISKDLRRVMNRLKATYRGWGIPCSGTKVYAPHYREEWLNKIKEAGVRRRAELFYQHLDGLQILRRQVRRDFLVESRKHTPVKILRQIPCIGPIRAGLLLAIMQTPHRFRSKRQLWPMVEPMLMRFSRTPRYPERTQIWVMTPFLTQSLITSRSYLSPLDSLVVDCVVTVVRSSLTRPPIEIPAANLPGTIGARMSIMPEF